MLMVPTVNPLPIARAIEVSIELLSYSLNNYPISSFPSSNEKI